MLSDYNKNPSDHPESKDEATPSSDGMQGSSHSNPNPNGKARYYFGPALAGKIKNLWSSLTKIELKKSKLKTAFINFSTFFSLTINIFLLVVVLLLSRQIFALRRMVVGDILGGLYTNMGEMDQAIIDTRVNVKDYLEVDFPIQLKQSTEVILEETTYISGAIVTLTTGNLSILNAPANIVLPAGTRLPITLNMTVPVNTTIPINMDVPVNIAISSTDLHNPIQNIQNIFKPYVFTLLTDPFTWQEVPSCRFFKSFCNWWFE